MCKQLSHKLAAKEEALHAKRGGTVLRCDDATRRRIQKYISAERVEAAVLRMQKQPDN